MYEYCGLHAFDLYTTTRYLPAPWTQERYNNCEWCNMYHSTVEVIVRLHCLVGYCSPLISQEALDEVNNEDRALCDGPGTGMEALPVPVTVLVRCRSDRPEKSRTLTRKEAICSGTYTVLLVSFSKHDGHRDLDKRSQYK